MRIWIAGLLIVVAGAALVMRQFWLAGAALVAASGVYILYRETLKAREARATDRLSVDS